MEIIANRNLPSHRQNKNCPCADCSQDRTHIKCDKPYKCAKLARDILQCILPKWHPLTSAPPYSLNIDPEQITADTNDEDNHLTLFDPTYPSPDSLTDGFQVFTTLNAPCNVPARQAPKPSGEPPKLISIIITGTHKIDKDGYYVSGGGAWFGQDDQRNKSIKVPEHLAAPGAGEVGAILSALSSLPINAPLQLMVKSPSLRKNLTKNLTNQEDTDWMDHPNRILMKVLVAQLRKRCALTTIIDTNKLADKTSAKHALALAKEGMVKDTYDTFETKVDAPFEISGMKLHIGTQRTFYKNIRNVQIKSKQRRLTNMNMARTLYAIGEANGATPTSEQVWLSIRHKDIPKSIRGFLWKSLHSAYKIGEFWDKIPHYENRGKCGLCSLPESMDHILLECDESPASRVIWKAAKDLWLKRENNWPDICFGSILGCNLITVRDSDGKEKVGATRLLKILILESAHLIWKLRCERTIKFGGDREKHHSENEIYNKWLHAINMRLKFDRLLTDSMRYGKKASKIDIVLKTWSGLLKNEDDLPDNWIRQTGVLVGMTPRPPPGRLR
ncbi:ribonuclease H-like protein [Suillus occidentalis]|nr:ribonuclease H-like protein [Suillus occidentalis]